MDQLRDVVAYMLLPASKAQHTGQDLWLQWDVLGKKQTTVTTKQVITLYKLKVCNTHSTCATSLRGKKQ